MTHLGRTLAALAVVLLLAGCAPGAETAPAVALPQSVQTGPAVALPPSGGVADYQLGGAYEPDERVQIVARDRAADPADGRYSICYVNGFQTQPDELADWPAQLLLRTPDGEPFIDPDWPDEVILDTSSPAHRDAIAEIVGAWIERCAASGFQAVELDNLDTFTRTEGALTLDDNLALASALVEVAHGAGVAVGQKNAAEHAEDLHARAGFDFAVTEECAAYDECAEYAAVYGTAVVDIEYTDALPQPFAQLCADEHAPSSMVLRDRALSTPGDDGYVFQLC